MEALATTDELLERLPFVPDEDELREAYGALDDLSDQARHHGKPQWTTAAVTPQSVRNLILRAATRHMKNPDGYTQSRAGDETLTWQEKGDAAGSATFNQAEVKMLQAIAGRQGTGFHTVGMYAAQKPTTYEPVTQVPTNVGSPITMFNDESPW